ncbi:MAG: diaminopimelate epimerase [Gammaproteobacteria bacterium]|nr:diaminopimelate epimerase [Gammaproteobacteria bacterium]
MLKFTKMHGLGNDFVVINALEQAVNLDGEQVRRIAHRRLGVGCDQLLVIRPGTDGAADFLYSVYNADGSEAEHCGNGLRCVALYLRANGLIRKDELLAQTPAGLLKIYFEGDLVKVNMGCPDFEPARIPLAVAAPQQLYRAELDGGQVEFAALSMGNPHAVVRVDDVESAPVELVGPHLQRHALFPAGVNAGFMQILDHSHIRLRVYERGVGETLACGTGACAAVVAGIEVYNLADKVQVSLPGGSLTVAWAGAGEPVWMTGPGTTVYEGRIGNL